jgi:biopolymer transport protein ExbD
MGGGAMPEQGGGGKKRKKSLDAVINVVPAIDLLSCCITFLLYTAVWTQISRLQVQQFGAGAPPPPGGEQQKTLLVTLALGERSMVLSTSAGTPDEIPLVMRDNLSQPATPDAKEIKLRQDLRTLGEKLRAIKSANPEVQAITISCEDTIPYLDLVQVIDECEAQGLPSVSVTGV